MLKFKLVTSEEKVKKDLVIDEIVKEEKEEIIVSSPFNSSILEEMEESYQNISFDDLMLSLKENKYELFCNIKIDNIIIFYKFVKDSIHFIKISSEADYYIRVYGSKYPNTFKYSNYICSLSKIKEIKFGSQNFLINYTNGDKFNIACFHDYHYATNDKKTKEESEILAEEREKVKLKTQMLALDIIKKANKVNLHSL